jgi:hypothetical protein
MNCGPTLRGQASATFAGSDYALPSGWAAIGPDPEQALALALDHLSLYGLTVESGTPLGVDGARRDRLADDRAADEFPRPPRRPGSTYEASCTAPCAKPARAHSAYWQRRAFIGLAPGGQRGLERCALNVREREDHRRRSETAVRPGRGGDLDAAQVALEALPGCALRGECPREHLAG